MKLRSSPDIWKATPIPATPLAQFWTCSWLYNAALGKITVYLVSTHHSENVMTLQLIWHYSFTVLSSLKNPTFKGFSDDFYDHILMELLTKENQKIITLFNLSPQLSRLHYCFFTLLLSCHRKLGNKCIHFWPETVILAEHKDWRQGLPGSVQK